MPTKETVEKARRDLAQGKKPSTAAGEFVREEIEHVREGRHGARNTKQAIAIGLSKARRAGVPLPAPGPGQRDAAAGRRPTSRPSPRRSRATMTALRREGHQSASPRALATQAKRAARKRGPKARSQAARKAAATRSRRRARR